MRKSVPTLCPFQTRLGRMNTPMLRALRRDENTCRKDFTPSEMVALGRKLEELTPSRQGQRPDREPVGDSPTSSPTTRGKRPQVAAALGVGEQKYEHAKRVVEAAEEGDPVAEEAPAL